jgi:hypothetical protein
MAPKLSTSMNDPRIPGRCNNPLPDAPTGKAADMSASKGLLRPNGGLVSPTGRTTAQEGPGSPWQGSPMPNSSYDKSVNR